MRLALSACLLMTASAALAGDDPLLRPIQPDYAKRFLGPARPARIYGNTYMVGFADLSVVAIRTPAGVILLDGALPQGVRQIEANLKAQGMAIREVKYILSTEPHYDHAAGMAALQRDSGATVLASSAAARILREGGKSPKDPQAADLSPFPAPSKIRVMRDGQSLVFGGVTVKAVALPGHSPGSMGWTWRACEGRVCKQVVFVASINAAAPDSYRFSAPDHAALVASFRGSIARLAALPCDIAIPTHPESMGQGEKLGQLLAHPGVGPGANPYIDPKGCVRLAEAFAARLDKRLASEAK